MIKSINTFLVRTSFTVRWILTQRVWQSLETVLKVLLNQNFVKNSKMTSTAGSSIQEHPNENVHPDFSKSSLKVTKSLVFVANHIAQKNLHRIHLQVKSSSL